MKSLERWILGACFAISGATSLVLQVAWSKELSYILGSTLYGSATVVAAYMAGLGIGSALACIHPVRHRRMRRGLHSGFSCDGTGIPVSFSNLCAGRGRISPRSIPRCLFPDIDSGNPDGNDPPNHRRRVRAPEGKVWLRG